MTTSQIAKLLRARRSGKGKWQARCPVHGRDRSPSLSITEMPGGETRLHCFAGCAQKAVLDALGLTWRDLKIDTRIDPEVIRQIQLVEAKRKAQKETRTKLLWMARNRVGFWHRKSQVLGRSLWKWDNDKLARDFHYALAMERICQQIWETL